MDVKFLACICLVCAASAFAQDASLTETLPNGKVVTFHDADQKAKFDAAQEAVSTNAINSQKTADELLVAWTQAPAGSTIDSSSRLLWFKVVQKRGEGIVAVVAFA